MPQTIQQKNVKMKKKNLNVKINKRTHKNDAQQNLKS